ncbi:MAG TPA: 30S ribosomal protein S11, partial [Candidatus Vogelbacteria bacterium]|nr:30S ribosomal protein S11 [Candidatus Vogelbacteria bacterium]
ISAGIVHIRATYNNTAMSLTDMTGNLIINSSSGALGFKGSKKGTPFAAGKVGELIAEQGQKMGLKEVEIKVKGVGSGRESAIRAFMAKGINILKIKDITPIPFNGPRPPKPRRV